VAIAAAPLAMETSSRALMREGSGRSVMPGGSGGTEVVIELLAGPGGGVEGRGTLPAGRLPGSLGRLHLRWEKAGDSEVSAISMEFASVNETT